MDPLGQGVDIDPQVPTNDQTLTDWRSVKNKLKMTLSKHLIYVIGVPVIITRSIFMFVWLIPFKSLKTVFKQHAYIFN